MKKEIKKVKSISLWYVLISIVWGFAIGIVWYKGGRAGEALIVGVISTIFYLEGKLITNLYYEKREYEIKEE